MADRLNEFINRAKEFSVKAANVAGRAAETAGKKANEFVETTKLNVAIMNLQAEIDSSYKKIGAAVYEAKSDDSITAEVVGRIIEEIDLKFDELRSLKEKISGLKKEKKCLRCDHDNDDQANYCVNCGEKL